MSAQISIRRAGRRETGHNAIAARRHPLRREQGPELAVVIPTYCERHNVIQVIRRLRETLAAVSWEVIFVDDDSPDGTARIVRAIARRDRRVRCVQRIGRRGLSGACIEGVLASSAPIIAVIDADLQHDETILPGMLRHVREGAAELVVATRYSGAGGVGEWSVARARMSGSATRFSRLVYQHPVSDPMSGFFMLRRGLFEEALRELSTTGFKLLLDILATVKRPIAIKEVAYTFRTRVQGESKLDSVVVWDFGMLVIDKLIGRYVPMRFVAFSLVGGAGILVHLALVTMLLAFTALSFPEGQAVAASATMVFNYAVNNILTYRDRRRRRLAWLTGLASFMVACSLGGLANVTIAAAVYAQHVPWVLASLAGIIVGAVWNYAMTSRFTWSASREASR